MDTQPHVAHENGDVPPKVAIKGADGGPVQSQGAPHAEPAQPKLNTPFQSAAVAEEHSSTGPAVPASADESRHGLEAKKAQEPWAKGMEESAMHTPMQRDGDQTSKDLGPSEAGHSRRWVKVPKGWYAKKGNAVMDGLFVGDAIGKGMQVALCSLGQRLLCGPHAYTNACLASIQGIQQAVGICSACLNVFPAVMRLSRGGKPSGLVEVLSLNFCSCVGRSVQPCGQRRQRRQEARTEGKTSLRAPCKGETRRHLCSHMLHAWAVHVISDHVISLLWNQEKGYPKTY